jgi:hypothetical protein
MTCWRWCGMRVTIHVCIYLVKIDWKSALAKWSKAREPKVLLEKSWDKNLKFMKIRGSKLQFNKIILTHIYIMITLIYKYIFILSTLLCIVRRYTYWVVWLYTLNWRWWPNKSRRYTNIILGFWIELSPTLQNGLYHEDYLHL